MRTAEAFGRSVAAARFYTDRLGISLRSQWCWHASASMPQSVTRWGSERRRSASESAAGAQAADAVLTVMKLGGDSRIPERFL